MAAFRPPFQPPIQQHSRDPRFSALAILDRPQNLFINRMDHVPFFNPAEAFMKEMSESGTHLLTFIPIVLHREEQSQEQMSLPVHLKPSSG